MQTSFVFYKLLARPERGKCVQKLKNSVEGVLMREAYDDTGFLIKNRLHIVKPILFCAYLTVQIS